VREGWIAIAPGSSRPSSRIRPLDRATRRSRCFFNFSLNVLKGTVADALCVAMRGRVGNDLFTGCRVRN
jgi:hypothetical protein